MATVARSSRSMPSHRSERRVLATVAYSRPSRPHSVITRNRLLFTVWLAAFILSALGVHGSSLAANDGYWRLRDPLDGYVFAPVIRVAQAAGLPGERLRDALLARARWIRSDEHLVTTPFAVAQANHSPPYPVVNTNIGFGVNMFAVALMNMPIAHMSAVARPSTWGHLLFGPVVGVAWNWWFPIAACFTALTLLFEIVLRGRWKLAAFGAFWFVGSGYVVGWSFWPAYPTAFAALGLVAGQHLLRTRSATHAAVSGAVLGLSIAGLVMVLYPPWLVTLGYWALALFAGLAARDGLLAPLRRAGSVANRRRFLVGAGLAIGVAGAVLAAFAVDGWPGLRALANTTYPGLRVSTGGGYPLARLLRGALDALTLYNEALPPILGNQSTAASFYLLSPAVAVALVLGGSRFRRGLDAVDYAMLAYLAGALFFAVVGVPEFIARLTLLSFVTPQRVDLGIGLASIALCVSVLAKTSRARRDASPLLSRRAAVASAVVVAAVFAASGLLLRQSADDAVPLAGVGAAAIAAGTASAAMLTGRARAVCAGLGAAVALTTAFFHPLYRGLGPMADSELAAQIRAVARTSTERPVFASYGVGGDILAYALGYRAVSGVHPYPQAPLWAALDSRGERAAIYNRYAYLLLEYALPGTPAAYDAPKGDAVRLVISPKDAALRPLGVTHVIADAEHGALAMQDDLTVVYTSPSRRLTVFALDREPRAPAARVNLSGQADITCAAITGWVWDPADPAARIDLDLLDGDRAVVRLRARLSDGDLARAGIGDGAHAFSIPFPAALRDGAPHSLQLRAVGGGFEYAPAAPIACPPK